MKPVVLLFTCRFLVITSLVSVIKGDVLPAEQVQAIEDFVGTLIGCRPIVGLNLAIVKDGQTLLTKGYGYADLSTQPPRPVTETTLFSIASLTKSFTTTLLGQTLRESRLDWETPVREIIKNFYFNTTLLTNVTTLRDLATHATGIPGHNYARLQGIDRQDLLAKIRFFEPTKEIRTSFLYSNLMYGLLTKVTERLYWSAWEPLMTKKLLQPLEMYNTTFINTADLSSLDLAKPYLPYDGDWREVSMKLQKVWGELGGSGSILSNAEDMAQWLKLHLGNITGIVDDGVLEETHKGITAIPQTSSSRMYKRPTIPVTYDHGKYGMGWRDGYYRGLRMLLHTGSTWGYGAMMTLLPDLNIGIYTSVNGPDDSYYGRRLLHIYIMDILMGEEPWLNQTTACTFPDPWAQHSYDNMLFSHENPETDEDNIVEHDVIYMSSRTMKVSDSYNFDIDLYTGTYGNFAYRNITVYKDDGGLFLRYGLLGLWKLAQIHNDEFLGIGEGDMWSLNISSVAFAKERSGKMEQVTLALEKNDPPTFIRGLTMNDAPDPPDPNCGGSSNNSTRTNHTTAWLYIMIAIIAVLSNR